MFWPVTLQTPCWVEQRDSVVRSADTDRVFARRTGLGWGHRDKSSGPALEEFSGLEEGAGGGGHGNNYSTL